MSLFEREHEQNLLRHALDGLPAASSSSVIAITGPGGRGKTSLLEWARQNTASETRVVNIRRWGGSLTELVSQLPNDVFDLTSYHALQERLVELEQRVENAQLRLAIPDFDAPYPWQERLPIVQSLTPESLHFIVRRLRRLYETYDRSTQSSAFSEQAAMFIRRGPEDVIQLNAANLGQLRAFVDAMLLPEFSDDDWNFYLQPEETLAQAVAHAIQQPSAAAPLLITIDEYALLIEGEKPDNFINLVLEKSGPCLWLIAAQQKPDWLNAAQEIALTPLSPTAIQQYFEANHNRSLSETELSWFTRLTGGEPLTVRLAADLYANGASEADLDTATSRTPSNPLEGLFLYFVEESGQLTSDEQRMLYTLAILRTVTPEFLELYTPAVEAEDFSFEPQLAFDLIQRHPWLDDGTQNQVWPQLHPGLKNYLRKYLTVERRRFSRPVQEGIVQPARNVAGKLLVKRETYLLGELPELGSLRSRVRDAEWGQWATEMGYYRMWLDEAIGWVFLLPRWVMALAYEPALGRQFYEMAASIQNTFYVEGTELLPVLKTIMADFNLADKPRDLLASKLKAVQKVADMGTPERGRWFKSENLGQRQGGKGSGEAEVRGILSWLQCRIYEASGQYERTAPIYESVLATNVEMPELRQAAARAALVLASRYRLKGAHESAFSALNRALELLEQPTPVLEELLLWSALRVRQFDIALKMAERLENAEPNNPDALLFAAFALWAQGRPEEAQTALRSYAAAIPTDTPDRRQQKFRALINYSHQEEQVLNFEF